MTGLAQKFLAIFGRADPAHLTKHAREVLLCFESASDCDIEHPQFRSAQDLLRTLHPMTQNKLVWTLSCRLAKHL